MKKQVTFTAKGVVLGNFWGGGKGAYPAQECSAHSEQELIEQIRSRLDDGSLDSGMGYESLIGAAMTITTTTQIELDDKVFVNKEYNDQFFGDLDESDQDFLIEVSQYYH